MRNPFEQPNLGSRNAEVAFFFFFCNILPDKFNQSQRTANITLAPARVAWNNSALHLRCYHSSAGNSTLQRKLSRLTITPALRNEASVHLCEKKIFIQKSETSFKEIYHQSPRERGAWLLWFLCQQCKHYFGRGANRHSCHYISWGAAAANEVKKMLWQSYSDMYLICFGILVLHYTLRHSIMRPRLTQQAYLQVERQAHKRQGGSF